VQKLDASTVLGAGMLPGSNYLEEIKITREKSHFRPMTTITHINVEGGEYADIKIEEAARMIGFFTQVMESRGFPWSLYRPTGGRIIRLKQIGEFEALKRLEKDKPVIFRPERIIGIGLTSPQFKVRSNLQQAAAGGATDVKMNTGGIEVKFGEYVEINSLTELKFFYRLYSRETNEESPADDPVCRASKQLAFFTIGTLTGEYPWKMFKPLSFFKNLLNMIEGGLKASVAGAAVGIITASIFSLPALAFGSFQGGQIGIMTGAGIGMVVGFMIGTQGRKKGGELNALEVLSRLLEEKPVYFQEMKKREMGLFIPFPIGLNLGSLSFYSYHREGSVINNLEELELFHHMQEMP
jgi:hypothetical protein